MANIDRYRPPQRAYEPSSVSHLRSTASPTRRRDHVPPAVPSPPVFSSRTSPPQALSHRNAPSPRQSSPNPPSPTSLRNQWYFDVSESLSTPSIMDGLAPPEERLRRTKGVNFIFQAAVRLELPQMTIWVAGVFFHRFYMRRSMVVEKGGIHHYNVAATSLFLANKTEENCRKTKDLIVAVAKVAQKNPQLQIDEQSKEYWRWRDSILQCEESMLEVLCFDLSVETPYQILFNALKRLGCDRNKHLRHAAWAFCNDSCYTLMPIMLNVQDIALAAIFFATVQVGAQIEDNKNGEPWWKVFDTPESSYIMAVTIMRNFWLENPMKANENHMGDSRSPIYTLETTRKKVDAYLSQFSTCSTAGTPIGTDGVETKTPPTKSNGKNICNSKGTGLEEIKSEPTFTEEKTCPELGVINRKNTEKLSPAPKRKTPDDVGSRGSDTQFQKRTKHE